MLSLSHDARFTVGVLLLSLTTIEIGGGFLLRVVRGRHPASDLQKAFFRAGHAHAGVLVTLAIATQPFVDAAELTGVARYVARDGIALAAILMPAGFFLSVLGRDAAAPNKLLGLLYAGAISLAAGAVTLGTGLLSTT